MMKRMAILWSVAIIALLVLAVPARTGSGYDLNWWTVDGGGGRSSGGGYTLDGTLGQPDAGALSGGGYILEGGFWQGGAAAYNVYLPLVVRNH